MIKITVNGKQHEIPTRWEDVTFRKFMEVAELPNRDSAILAYYLGMDEETIKKAKITNLETVLSALAFHQRDMDYSLPKRIREYEIPPDVEFCSMGQYDDLRSILDEVKEGSDPREHMKKYPLIVATYTCSQAYGRPYDYKDAEKLEPYFWDAPASEVLAVGHFTLLKCAKLKRRRRMGYLHNPILTTKSEQGSIGFRKVLGSLIRYFGWRLSRLTRGTS